MLSYYIANKSFRFFKNKRTFQDHNRVKRAFFVFNMDTATLFDEETSPTGPKVNNLEDMVNLKRDYMYMDSQRKNSNAYNYLCHVGEAKEY
jgi:hypothetical protein